MREGNGEEKIRLVEMIINEMKSGKERNPPNFSNIEHRKVKKKTRLVGEVIQYIPVKGLEKINNPLKAVASWESRRKINTIRGRHHGGRGVSRDRSSN